jgi:hypothetical protein
VRSEATGGRIVPRLALAYDVNGDGRVIFHTTYGHYAGRYNEAQIGANTNVGNPDLILGIYEGPIGVGRNFSAGLDPANYETATAVFPTANVFIADGLSSPITKEFTVSGGGTMGRGYADATYIWRSTDNLIEDFIDLSNGTTHVVQDGIDVGTFTNIVYRNSNVGERNYQAAVFQGRYTVGPSLTLNGNWTIQLKNEGNYEGEAANQPGITSIIGDYPQAFDEARNYPTGRLNTFQRHRARIWAIYNMSAGRAGDFSVSGLVRIEGPQAYSLYLPEQPLSLVQEQLLSAYRDQPASQQLYFGGRGTQDFKGYGVLDMSVNYNIPVVRSLRPWIKFDVFNLLNNDKLIKWNTTISPDPRSALDALGRPTGYIQGRAFGTGTSNTNYPQSIVGTGLRGFRVAFGIRF